MNYLDFKVGFTVKRINKLIDKMNTSENKPSHDMIEDAVGYPERFVEVTYWGGKSSLYYADDVHFPHTGKNIFPYYPSAPEEICPEEYLEWTALLCEIFNLRVEWGHVTEEKLKVRCYTHEKVEHLIPAKKVLPYHRRWWEYEDHLKVYAEKQLGWMIP